MNEYHEATGRGTSLNISNKQVREVLLFIKGLKVDSAIKRLEGVLEHKEAVPFKRFNRKVQHKPGIMAGRYPEKTCEAIIRVLKNAKSNAISKGLQEEKLIISEGVTMMDISKRKRIRARKGGYTGSMKLTSLMIKLKEKEEEKKQKKEVKKK